MKQLNISKQALEMHIVSFLAATGMVKDNQEVIKLNFKALGLDKLDKDDTIVINVEMKETNERILH